MKLKKKYGYYNSLIFFVIKFLTKIGLGRGGFKKLFNFIIKKFYGFEPVDFEYLNFRFRLYPMENSTDNKIIVSSKIIEKIELGFLKKIKSKNIFLDIGANIGFYSINAASYGFKKIHAFEPIPKVVERLKTNIYLNNYQGIIEVVPFGLGESNQNLEIRYGPYNIGEGSLINSHPHMTNCDVVKIITLKNYLNKLKIKKVDAIKIDVEGYEDKALLPYLKSINTLSNLPNLIIIEHSSSEIWTDDIISWLFKKGYKEAYKSRSNTIMNKDT